MTQPEIVMTDAEYVIRRATDLPFQEAVTRVTAELKEEGFGILTEIDVKSTLKQKIDADFPEYTILGACSPPLALEALTAEPGVGTLLPCNVVVNARPDGKADVTALNPSVAFDRLVKNAEVGKLARDVEARITRALDRVANGG